MALDFLRNLIPAKFSENKVFLEWYSKTYLMGMVLSPHELYVICCLVKDLSS